MKKEYSQEISSTGKGPQTSEWAIGTKFQPPQQKSDFVGNNQANSQRNVPKIKGRNPFQVLTQLAGSDTVESNTITQESISLLSQFNTQQFNASDFVCEVIHLNDKRGFTNNDVLEFVLSQAKIRDLFARMVKSNTTSLIKALLQSIQINSAYENKGQCIRMIGHLLYEDNEFEVASLETIYKQISKYAFDQQLAESSIMASSGESGLSQQNQQQSAQNSSSKLQRLAINCLANLYLKPSPQFMKTNGDSLHLKLKSVFEQLMRKIHLNFRSKRFISTLTTVIRALQLSMNQVMTNQKIVINDNESIKLFLHFYKLLFLGSPFAEKMLHIKFEESKTAPKNKAPAKLINFDEESHEELKSDSGSSFIIDTSDFSSQSDNGSMYSKNSPTDNTGTDCDHYQKIKNYAVLCLQYLFKSNNKTLFNYWYLLFPSFFMKPQSEFSKYLTSFKEKKEEFYEKTSQIVMREPSMFYLLKASENNSKLKNTICFTISIMLENQMIQKWQGQLEKEGFVGSSVQGQSSNFVSMANILGQFLRFLHYQLMYMIKSEADQQSTLQDTQVLCQLIKTAGTLIHSTPYAKMNKGLATLLIETLITMLVPPPASPHQPIAQDTQVRLALINTLSIAFNVSDIKEELNSTILSSGDIIHFLTSKSSDYIATESIQLLQRIAKNYPQWILESFDKISGYIIKHLSGGSDKKKMVQILKIIEELVKNYKSKSLMMLTQGEDEEEEELVETQSDKQTSPYNLQSFKAMMNIIIDNMFTVKSNQPVEISIAILSILNNLDTLQWKQTFSPSTTITKILGSIYQANKAPPLLKAASIKMLGYMVYFDISQILQSEEEEKQFMNKVYSMIFESAGDSNINVQIRTSWTIANLNFISKISTKDEYLAQEILLISISFAMSTKEKVTSNGLRSLGYFLQSINLQQLSEKILSQIIKSPQLMLRVTQIMGVKKPLTVDSLILIILDNLDNKSPKIAWNSCVALANILDNPSLQGSEILFSKFSLKPLLASLEQSSNFKTKIHAASTLMKFKDSSTFTVDTLFADAWVSLMNTLNEHNKAVYTTQDQRKYVQTLDITLFTLWNQLAATSATSTELTSQLKTFINGNSLTLLQTFTEYLRKDLKVPEYSEMYDDKEQLHKETETLFVENDRLEGKLNLLKGVFCQVRNLIKENEDVHVSFGVYDSFNSLADSSVKEYRLLDCLKMQKTSFQPLFEDHSSSSDNM